MKRALLHDKPASTKHNLGALVVQNGEITLGRECGYTENVICLGVDSGHDKVGRISGRHAKITYNPEKDIYSIGDAPSKNGTQIKRGPVRIDVGVRKVEMQDGDELYFAKYGPVFFHQTERITKKDDGTKMALFDD